MRYLVWIAASLAAAGAGAVSIEKAVPARDRPGPLSLVVRLLRPDGTVGMERTLSAP